MIKNYVLSKNTNIQWTCYAVVTQRRNNTLHIKSTVLFVNVWDAFCLFLKFFRFLVYHLLAYCFYYSLFNHSLLISRFQNYFFVCLFYCSCSDNKFSMNTHMGGNSDSLVRHHLNIWTAICIWNFTVIERAQGGQEGYAILPSHLVNYVNQTLVKEELEIHDV